MKIATIARIKMIISVERTVTIEMMVSVLRNAIIATVATIEMMVSAVMVNVVIIEMIASVLRTVTIERTVIIEMMVSALRNAIIAMVATIEMMVSVVTVSVLKIVIAERIVTIEEMGNIAMVSAAMVSARIQGKDRILVEIGTIMTAEGVTTEVDLVVKVQIRADLCQRVQLKMQRSIEMKKNVELVRKKTSGTAKI